MFSAWVKSIALAGLTLASGSLWGSSEKGAITLHRAQYDAIVRRDGLLLRAPNGETELQLRLLGADVAAERMQPGSARVQYRGVYPGIDLVYYDNQGRLEYDFAVAPGSNPQTIAFAVEGAADLHVDAGGALLARTADGQMRLDAPVIYQPGPHGVRSRIAGGYAVAGNRVTFRVGAYDRSKRLIIDPVINYSTYVGNSGDSFMAATADSSGNAYLVGRSSGLILLQKLSPDGTTVLLRQTLGSTTSSFQVAAVALGPSGKVYITGYSAAGLPTTAGAFIASVTSGSHAFLAVTDSSFNLLYCSYLAGTTSAFDEGNSVAADAAGNAYITGYTNSTTFPTTPGVFQTTPSTTGQTGFVAKFNPTALGSASLVYATYLTGPTTSTDLIAIAVDASNNAYLTGTAGLDFPVTAGTFQYDGQGLGYGGIYVTKLNATATALSYSAYLGPGQANGIALDTSGNAYVTGFASVSDFPTTSGAYQTIYPGAFATELNTTGTSLIYGTYLAGPTSALTLNEAVPVDIALVPGCASACSAYISGYTAATDFPVLNPIQNFNAGTNDAFVVELSGNGSAATFSTYLGGSSDDSNQGYMHIPAVGVMSTGDVIVAGATSSTDFPVTLTTTPTRSMYSVRISSTAGSKGIVLPVSLSFNSQAVTVPSTPQSAVLRNLGSSALAISSIVAAGDYSQTNTCGSSLAGGGECSISVTFTPTSNSNPRTGTVTINGTIVLNLTGTGTNGAYMTLAPTSLTFASTPVGSAAPSQNVVVANIGNQALTLGSGAFSPSGDFAQTNNCPASLAQNTNCTMSVSFLPTQVGQRTGSVFISATP